MANTDFWKIYGFATTADQGEMVFQVGDNGSAYASGGERFRFNYDNTGGGAAKDVFIVDYDSSNFNTNLIVSSGNNLGVGVSVPSGLIHADGGASTARMIIDADNGIARIFSFRTDNLPRWALRVDGTETGSNVGGDFSIRRYDDTGAFVDAPLLINRASGQSTFSKKVVIENNAGDQQLQIVSTTAPSLRIDNLQTGPTKRAGLGISTATNNFIQGSADRDFCIFNGSTTASPILFGIYDTTNVQEAARISTARNFLIGTTTDDGTKLQVAGFITAQKGIFNSQASGNDVLYLTTSGANTNFAFKITGAANDYLTLRRFSNAGGSLDIMSLTFGGNIGFGTNTPIAKVHAIGNSTTEEIFYAEKSTASFTGNIITSLTYTSSGTGWNHFVGYSDIGGVTNIKILGNGNIQNANNSYGAISDIKLKENIVDTNDKLNDLLKVKIRNFNLIGQQMKQIGVIAQELETIFPNLIEETNDIDKNGVNLGTTTKSVKYSVFIPILIKAMQELNAKIENLK
jgi:hypothetical protein